MIERVEVCMSLLLVEELDLVVAGSSATSSSAYIIKQFIGLSLLSHS